MKKTVNINLAGTFFHIDEDAYGKLSRYLQAIKRSLSDPLGGDEIIRDIEARISELFAEKITHNTQVVSLNEVDEVIAVMGQPEDYIMDEETFSENQYQKTQATASNHKQLYRDIDNKFIAGVSSGLGHYLKIDAVWVRLAWILITFLTSGSCILVYILLWILIPGAETTSEKLKMTGEPINISNIEKKFKEGYQTVSDSIKNADFEKYGEKVKKNSATFFDSIGSVIVTILKVALKFFGLIIMIAGLLGFISLVIGVVVFGTIGLYNGDGGVEIVQFFEGTHTPIWLASLLVCIVIGIPLIVLFVLGLKIISNNVKTIGTPIKIALFVIWIGAIISLTIFGIEKANEHAYEEHSITETQLPFNTEKPFKLTMNSNRIYQYEAYKNNRSEIKTSPEGERVLYSSNIRLIVRNTTDDTVSLIIKKSAQGKDYTTAKSRADDIQYTYTFENNTLKLDGYFLSKISHKFHDQELEIVLYLPNKTILIADPNTQSFHSNTARYRDILIKGDEGKHLLITPNGTKCLDCTKEATTSIDEHKTTGWEKEVNQSLNKVTDTKHHIIVTDTTRVPQQTIDNDTIININ